jgi:cation:H+ antiporter
MIISEVLLVIFGFVLLIGGSNLLVDGSSNIAKKYNIPEIIIGLTIVSIGTSMPELFVSITSALNNYSDMAIGNIIGSNIANMLLILGVSSMIQAVEFQKETRLIEIPLCLFITAVFMLICNINNDITRGEAVVLIIMFILFIVYTIYMAKKEQSTNNQREKETETKSLLKNVIYVILGILALKIGGDFAVDNAVKIAQQFNLTEKIISVTILAVGTSLPELVTSVTAAIKGESDIAIGNILGSNIFNMLLIIGVSALIKPIVYNTSYNMDLTILMIATIVLAVFPYIPPKNKMSRINGFIYFMMYVGYMLIIAH